MDETVIQAFIRLNRVVGGTDGKPHRVPGSCCTKLAVYNVVPTGAFGGLIQVVDNAPSLFYMYSQHASHQMAKQDGKSAVGGGRTPPHAWPPNVVVEIYDSLAKAVQANILHAQLVRAAQSPGHLYLATKNIVKSIGMASIAGYLLGLGDRHLDNLLVDLQRGQLIPIDFNVCFDFGGISRVPEQVPFRMT
ncbi:kinase-like protein, partial [Martensiomyces pterosporus]